MKRALTITCVAAGLTVGGCGGGAKHVGVGATNGAPTSAGAGAGAGAGATAGAPASVAVRAAHGYGRLLVDGQGRTLYLFTRDAANGSSCGGACAKAWPPLIVSSTPGAGAGVQGSALSAIRRTDGALQASYHGHPLYYFEGDRRPGEINCQDAEEFGGHWWLVKPSGVPNRASP